MLPAVPQPIVSPVIDVSVTCVLLNDALMWAMPLEMFLRGLRFVVLAMAYFIPFTDFLPATVFLGPLRLRALVRVR